MRLFSQWRKSSSNDKNLNIRRYQRSSGVHNAMFSNFFFQIFSFKFFLSNDSNYNQIDEYLTTGHSSKGKIYQSIGLDENQTKEDDWMGQGHGSISSPKCYDSYKANFPLTINGKDNAQLEWPKTLWQIQCADTNIIIYTEHY